MRRWCRTFWSRLVCRHDWEPVEEFAPPRVTVLRGADMPLFRVRQFCCRKCGAVKFKRTPSSR
jgi:hypothetical protein